LSTDQLVNNQRPTNTTHDPLPTTHVPTTHDYDQTTTTATTTHDGPTTDDLVDDRRPTPTTHGSWVVRRGSWVVDRGRGRSRLVVVVGPGTWAIVIGGRRSSIVDQVVGRRSSVVGRVSWAVVGRRRGRRSWVTHDPRATTHDPRPTTDDRRPRRRPTTDAPTTHDPSPTTHHPQPMTQDPRFRSEQRPASVALLMGGSRAEAPREQLSLSLLPGTPAISYRLRRRHSYL